MRPLFRLAAFAAVAAVLAACDLFTDVDEERFVGVVRYNNRADSVITAADTVIRGVAFNVTVRTYHEGCSQRAGAEVTYEGQNVTITPYDKRPTGNIVCPGFDPATRRLDRVVTLRLDAAGKAYLRVNGRAVDSAGNDTGEATIVDSVFVRSPAA
ncbi:MAG TPA: hypothetical protein VHG91_06785 [Longimicrobium sp.]|nr:hypothetical protein [Longimicrobium sp.]